MTTEALFQPPAAKDIDACTAELAVAFQRQIDAGTVRVYRDTMSDLPLWAIKEASLRIRRKGGSFFPAAPEWHRVAEEIVRDKQRQSLTERPSSETVHECEQCRDTGWCDEDRDGRTVCIPCSCRPWNTTYQRMTLSSRKSQNEELKSKAKA